MTSTAPTMLCCSHTGVLASVWLLAVPAPPAATVPCCVTVGRVEERSLGPADTLLEVLLISF